MRSPSLVQVRSFLACVFTGEPASATEPDVGPGEERSSWIAVHDGPAHLWFRPRRPETISAPVDAHDRTWLLGDDAEWDAASPLASMVSGVAIQYDAARRAIHVSSSIVGLPPVFLYRDARCVALASDLYLLAGLPHFRLELDPTSVEQLGSIGHPVGHRTLFKNTQLVPGGASVIVTAEGGATVQQAWKMPAPAPTNWDSFIDTQIAAFSSAVKRMDVSRSVLSLTAGLDTRTVFASLASEGRLVPGVTISGLHPSLDARTARELCRAYGVRHEMVTLDEEFTRGLPAYVEEASRLSGGLESLEQAPEVYFNRQLSRAFGARVSGNLGNQVGRGGTEGVGVRGAGLDILSAAMRQQKAGGDNGHWLLAALDDEQSGLAFILQQEIPFTSVANFSVGSHFAVQQSPYADRRLIETLPLRPASSHSKPSGSMVRMRLRDLNHRFFGEPAAVSFQRSLLKRIGGVAATYPINYGWRAAGGVSPMGLTLGAATLVGMVLQKARLDDGVVGGVVSRTGIPALHNFRHSTRWLRRHLRDFTFDVLSSRPLRESGVFDTARLDTLVQEHFGGRRDHHETVVYALDVALAHRLFCTR